MITIFVPDCNQISQSFYDSVIFDLQLHQLTCSCSHFMTQELLAKTVKEAAKAAHKRLRQVEFRTQAPDHPILWANSANVPESYYLKFFIFQVVDEK